MARKPIRKAVTAIEIENHNLTLAVAYCRMSSDKQDTSIAQQRKQIEDYFGQQFHIVEVYVDECKSCSKNTEKRTEFLRMISDLCDGRYHGKIKHILCLDLTRFGRLDTLDGAEHKKQLRRAKVKL